MAFYRRVGVVPPKRHTQSRDAAGRLLLEELIGADGFSSDSSLLYHRRIPSAVQDARAWDLPDQETVPNHPLLPRHLRLPDLGPAADGAARGPDLVTGRRLLLANSDVRLSWATATAGSPLYRNAIGDELVFVESGRGVVQTILGDLPYRDHDFVVIPRGITHRWQPAPDAPTRALVVAASSHIGPARRYLSRHGQFLEHAPYCERDLHGPTEPLLVEEEPAELLLLHRGPAGPVGTRWLLPQHPFDVVGWDGCLYPFTFSVSDFEPITGRIHQPPPAHQVFEGQNFVVCAFVPRKVDYHPLAIPVPYYHSNVDSDEVMLYVAGDYEARRGSGVGPLSITLHPAGHTHGPQPGAYEGGIGKEYFDELAIMVDTFAPLRLGEGARACDDPAYAASWARPPA